MGWATHVPKKLDSYMIPEETFCSYKQVSISFFLNYDPQILASLV